MRKLFLISLALVAGGAAMAKPRTQQQILAAASQALGQLSQQRAPQRGEQLTLQLLHTGEALSVVGYADGGYAVVTGDDLLPAVVGYSASAYSADNTNFGWWLRAMEASARDLIDRGETARLVAPPAGVPRHVPQMLTSAWGQMEPSNDLCPEMWNGRAVVGCVATAMTQIMYYHRYPTQGTGRYTDVQTTDRQGNVMPLTVDFADYTFNYSRMRDTYVSGNYTADEARAVAELSYAVGVSFGMIYGADASGTFSDSAAVSLRQHLGYPKARLMSRFEHETGEWMNTIFNELGHGRPLMYSGADDIFAMGGGGHAFVFDGYDAQGLVHVNWGWFGSNDGYYDVSLLNPRQHSFTNQQDMVIGVEPPGMTAPQTLTLTPADLRDGQLPALACYGSQAQRIVLPEGITAIGDGAFAACPKLLEVVFPQPNADQQFVVVDNVIYNCDRTEVIEVLPYYYNNVSVQPDYQSLLTVPEGVTRLHDHALDGCFRIKGVTLPSSLLSVGTEVFRGATNLKRITVGCPLPPDAAWGAFDGVDVGYTRLVVPAGSSERYRRAAEWYQLFALDNVVEYGTNVRARSLVREVGQPNPALTYEMLGQWVEGEPVLSCEADELSPAGVYPIVVSMGTLMGQDIVLTNGTLTIVEPSAIQSLQADEPASVHRYSLMGQRLTGASDRGISINNHTITFIK